MRVRLHLLLLFALGGCGTEPQRAPAPPSFVTIVQDDAELLHRAPDRIAATLDDLRAAGVDWVRVTAGWDVVEPVRGQFQWAALDRLHAMATERGLELNIDIAFFLPGWTGGRMDAGAYADFAEAVARRYPDAAAFTVWNEPNLATFLRPQWRRDGEPLSPDTYRAMVLAAVPRIEAAAPDALVLIGATSSLGETRATDADTRMAPLTFLRALTAKGPPLPGDGWSHHPYMGGLPPGATDPQPATVRMGDLDRLTDELHRLFEAGRFVRDLPVYVTEYGDQTNPPDPTWDITPAEQARRLGEGERIARENPRVRSMAQFLVRDLPERPGADLRTRWRDYQSGLFFVDGRPKPARAAFGLPLTAERSGDRVAFWGLVRRAGGGRRVVIRADGRVVAEARTREDGTFTATAEADPGATFRASSGDRRSAALRGTR